MEYLPIDAVLTRIPTNLREEENNDLNWKSWALQYLRTVNQPDRYVHDVDFLELKDHKCKIPDGLKKITAIRYLAKKPTKSQLDEVFCCPCKDTTTVTDSDGNTTKVVTHTDSCLLTHRVFLNSSVWNDCFRPLRFVGTVGENYFTKYSEPLFANECTNSFSITTDGCFFTSLKEGLLAIEFIREPKDAKDRFLVPKEPEQLWQAMAYYGIAKHWENRVGAKEANAHQLSIHYFQRANLFMREAKGIMTLKNIDFLMQESTLFDEQKIIRMPAVFSYGYGNRSPFLTNN